MKKIKWKKPHFRLPKSKFFNVIYACVLIAAAGIVVLAGVSYVGNLTFEETFYQVGNGKITGNLRIIQLSDLHNTSFGKNNKNLVERVRALAPDIIVATGDMTDKRKDDEEIFALCRELSDVAPLYWIYGNNECDRVYDCTMTKEALDSVAEGNVRRLRKSDDTHKKGLEKAGAKVLLNDSQTITVGENTVDIYGVLTSNPSAFWEYNTDQYDRFLNENKEHFKLMLTHEPYVFEEFKDGYWGDLLLAGHTHGGVIRIPYMGGLYESKNGVFPEKKLDDTYVAGAYDIEGKTLIVSRGLTNRGVIRMGNKPELVIVDINRY